ncbi:SRPBCC family protein [Streptomyces sp. SP17BM10]|uniref:SRPBCC family protein n=1 Tax=Streptomyces sp. SP17BM10 TaxID=3002530 RepID=UPI002E7A968F|nr:SRPBCC family protein [Streptomyces sp. SP17BM10]MEE1783980.1 SRPBCC family protein [Streptomyces sp. SP17BM10]
MATIHRDVPIDAAPEEIWAAIRDWGEVHRRLAPGFVTDTRVEGDVRVVTFADGTVVHELIVSLDDDARRIAYALVGGSLDVVHHHASMQVFAEAGRRSRFVWITDLQPHGLAEPIAAMIDQGIRVIRRTLEATATPAS